MRNITIEYLSKFIDLYHFVYPKDMVKNLSRFVDNIKNTLAADIKSKHSQYHVHELLNENKLIDIFQLDPTIEAIFYYRLQRSIFLNMPDHPILPYLSNLMKFKTGIEIYYSTEIGEGLNIQHGVGIVIGPRNKIGRNLMIHQGVTIGQKYLYSPHETVIIGDNVTCFAGAKIIGNIKIGDNVQIGANAVLLTDAESDAIYAGVPAKKIKSLLIGK